MTASDPLQQNIRRTTGQRVLKEICAIVDEENRSGAETAGTLRWLLRYGWTCCW
jgi:hypothetical protein